MFIQPAHTNVLFFVHLLLINVTSTCHISHAQDVVVHQQSEKKVPTLLHLAVTTTSIRLLMCNSLKEPSQLNQLRHKNKESQRYAM